MGFSVMGSLQQHATELHSNASVVEIQRQGALQMSLPHVGLPRGGIRLSHELTTSVYSLSIHAHRMLALALSKVIAQLHEQDLLNEEDIGHDPDSQLQRPLPPAIFSLAELKNIFGCNYREVGRLAKIACADLMSTNITHYRSKDWRMCQWATFAERTGSHIRIDIHPLLRQYITSLNKLYTLYTLDDVAHFKTSAQFRLYELFKMNAHKTYISMSQQELKQFLAIDDHLYMKDGKPVRKNFKMRILDPSLEKINQHTDLEISVQYADTPNGSGFAFQINEKENRQRSSSDLFAAHPLPNQDVSIQKAVEEAARLTDESVSEDACKDPATTQIELMPDSVIPVDQIANKGEYRLEHLNLSTQGRKWIEMMLPCVSSIGKALAHTRISSMIQKLEDMGVSDRCVEVAINNAIEYATKKKNAITSLVFFETFIENEHRAMQLAASNDSLVSDHKPLSSVNPVKPKKTPAQQADSDTTLPVTKAKRTKSTYGVVSRQLELDAQNSLQIIEKCAAVEAECKRQQEAKQANQSNETEKLSIKPVRRKVDDLLAYIEGIEDISDIEVSTARTGSFASLMDNQE